jgi:hypothetical protein
MHPHDEVPGLGPTNNVSNDEVHAGDIVGDATRNSALSELSSLVRLPVVGTRAVLALEMFDEQLWLYCKKTW